MYVFKKGLLSCMCECEPLCQCLPVWVSTCLCMWTCTWMCVSGWGSGMHHCDSAVFYWFSWGKRTANVRTATGQCPEDFHHKTPSWANTLCGRTEPVWCSPELYQYHTQVWTPVKWGQEVRNKKLISVSVLICDRILKTEYMRRMHRNKK